MTSSSSRSPTLPRVYDAQHRLAWLIRLDEPSGQAQLRLQEGPDAGIDIIVPANLLQITGDDTYALPLDLDEKLHEDSMVAADEAEIAPASESDEARAIREALDAGATRIPVHEESLQVGKTRRRTGRGVRIVKTVTHRTQDVDEPLRQDRFTIAHVPRDEFVDAAPAPRQEGDTWIFPVVEEVLVVEKRLRLKEEIHITRRQDTVHAPQKHVLRSEHVEAQRFDRTAPASSDNGSSAAPTDGAPPDRNRSG